MSEAQLQVAASRREQPPKIAQRDFQVVEYAYARFAATLPVGVTLETAMQPEFWSHVCHMLQKTPVTNEPDRAGAIIEVRTADHAFYAELYVRAVQARGLHVELLREVKTFGPALVKSNGAAKKFEIKWNVGKRGYDVIRTSDRELVADGGKLKTKELALAWVDEMTKDI